MTPLTVEDRIKDICDRFATVSPQQTNMVRWKLVNDALSALMEVASVLDGPALMAGASFPAPTPGEPGGQQ